MIDFTAQELLTICNWAMEKTDSAVRRKLQGTSFYELPKSIFDKANKEYARKQGQFT